MKNLKFLIIAIFLSYSMIQVSAQNNYHQKSYGIFVHYGFGGTAEDDFGCTISQYANGSFPQNVDETANNFDVQGFVNDLDLMSPEYLIFTIWHCGMNPLYPSDVMEKWLGPDHSGSERDVMQEILDACDAEGIDVYFYTQPSIGNSMRPTSQEAIGWINNSAYSETYNDYINEVYAEIVNRYKTQLKGFWFDKGLGFGSVDATRIGETIRAVIPDAVMVKNGFANDAPATADFGAVEVKAVTTNLEDEGYPNADDQDVDTWPAFERSVSFVADRDWFSNPGSIRYTSEEMYKYTVLEAGVNTEGGGVAWSLGPYPTTTISWNSGLLSGMTGLGTMINEVGESIKNTVPSNSWPTAEGARIQNLEWGIATRSADDDFEYLHVLNAPDGNTLTINAPNDGREYTSAINLRTGNSCEISQTSSQLSIILNSNDTWDAVDSVFKLTSGAISEAISGPAAPGDWSKLRMYGHAFKNEDFTDEQYDFIIDNFGIFTVEKRHARDIYGATNTEDAAEATAARIHAGNPDAKVLLYWSTNTAYTQYYTSVASAIEENPDWIDASNSRYTYPDDCKDWWVAQATENVNTRGLDGIFGDGAPGAESRGYIDDVTDNLGALSALSTFNLYNGYRVSSPTKMFAGPNTLANSDGVFMEAFFREPCDTKEEAEFLMDELLEVPSDKYIIARAASGDYGSSHDFYLACFLMIANDYSYFSWGGEGNSYAGDGTMTYWDSDFEQEIGEPLDVAIKNGYAYSRVFEHCTVNVDFENGTSSIEWGQNNSEQPETEYENVALNGAATQSTTAYEGDASRAIDGNTSGIWSDNSITHTEEVSDSWWMVTLDDNYYIGDITVYNRTDAAYIDRLSNFTIEVLNSNDEVVYTQTITSVPNPSVTVNASDVVGKQVRILQNDVSTPLSLAEVEVSGFTDVSLSTIDFQLENRSTLFNIYPNPVKNIVTIKLKSTKPVEYEVMNILGQVMLNGSINNDSNTFNLNSLNSGFYMIRVSNGVNVQMKKIVKK